MKGAGVVLCKAFIGDVPSYRLSICVVRRRDDPAKDSVRVLTEGLQVVLANV